MGDVRVFTSSPVADPRDNCSIFISLGQRVLSFLARPTENVSSVSSCQHKDLCGKNAQELQKVYWEQPNFDSKKSCHHKGA